MIQVDTGGGRGRGRAKGVSERSARFIFLTGGPENLSPCHLAPWLHQARPLAMLTSATEWLGRVGGVEEENQPLESRIVATSLNTSRIRVSRLLRSSRLIPNLLGSGERGPGGPRWKTRRGVEGYRNRHHQTIDTGPRGVKPQDPRRREIGKSKEGPNSMTCF